MQKTILILATIWISTGLLSACASSKTKVFGTDIPSMKTIHDAKFNNANDEILVKPVRTNFEKTAEAHADFEWLPNPTMTIYVFKHLTPAGHPVPGYTTFFRLYIQNHIAAPGELAGWE